MPGELIYGARDDMVKAVTDAGYDYIMMDKELTRYGGVETRDEGLKNVSAGANPMVIRSPRSGAEPACPRCRAFRAQENIPAGSWRALASVLK